LDITALVKDLLVIMMPENPAVGSIDTDFKQHQPKTDQQTADTHPGLAKQRLYLKWPSIPYLVHNLSHGPLFPALL
jgi:hypothetical protein